MIEGEDTNNSFINDQQQYHPPRIAKLFVLNLFGMSLLLTFANLMALEDNQRRLLLPFFTLATSSPLNINLSSSSQIAVFRKKREDHGVLVTLTKLRDMATWIDKVHKMKNT